MKIAVIGSGVFGSIVAIVLAKKHQIDLYEIKKDILNNASKFNQFRFHLGFHYPRSSITIKDISNSYKIFKKFFPKKIFGRTKNYYAIANIGSKTSYKKYLSILNKKKLKYKIIKNIKFPHTSNLILTGEKILNYFNFKKIIQREIVKKKINLFINQTLSKKKINFYDKIILCGYSNNNQILRKLGITDLQKYKYELIEKIIIKLPKEYKNKSYVILDGKFVCVDPYLGTKYHLLSDVKYSKIETVKRYFPVFKSNKKKYANKGMIKNLKKSNFLKFIKHSSKFLPFLKNAKYIGSFYTIRTLKMNVEKTDERTGYIKQHTNKIISVFSSKWNVSVNVGNKISKLF